MFLDQPVSRLNYPRRLSPLARSWGFIRSIAMCIEHRFATLVSAIVFVVGAGLVAWDYSLLLINPANYAWFWVGMLLCFLAAVSVGLRRSTGAGYHVLVLLALGTVLYLPYIFRSPARPIFNDELFHYQTVRLILEQGSISLPITTYPIPGEFPGLEFITLPLMNLSGLPLEIAARLVTLTVHMFIPLLAYLIPRGLGLGRRASFIAAMVYIANTSYYFFHSVFSYETVGILFVLTAWTLLARRARRGLRRIDLWLIIAVLFAVAVTHHVSSYMLAISLVIAWFVLKIRNRKEQDKSTSRYLGLLATLSVIFPIFWLFLGTERALHYLTTSISLRLQTIVRTIFAEQSTTRKLFKESPLPLLERAVDFAYAPLLLILGLLGIYLIFRRGRWRRATSLLLPLAIFGPLAWAATAPAILTRSSDMIYRAWPFLFIGLASYCAIALTGIAGWLGSKVRFLPLGTGVLVVLMGLLFTGGVSLGDNQAGRFQTVAPEKAAGPEAITTDVVSAAEWLERTDGRYHLVATDASTEVAFATYGYQRGMGWGNWTPFLADTPSKVSRFVRDTDAKYIIVDDRITKLLPRYQFYFGQAEVFALQKQSYQSGQAFPAELVAKFDEVDSLNRVYDNGNIRIYKPIVTLVDPLTSAQRPPALGSPSQETAQQATTTLPGIAFDGGYLYNDVRDPARRATVIGSDNGDVTSLSTLTGEFEVHTPEGAEIKSGTLTLATHRAEDIRKVLIRVAVNGTTVYEGTNPLFDTESAANTGLKPKAEHSISIDPSILRPGQNEVMIANLDPFNSLRYFVLDEMRVNWSW